MDGEDGWHRADIAVESVDGTRVVLDVRTVHLQSRSTLRGGTAGARMRALETEKKLKSDTSTARSSMH